MTTTRRLPVIWRIRDNPGVGDFWLGPGDGDFWLGAALRPSGAARAA